MQHGRVGFKTCYHILWYAVSLHNFHDVCAVGVESGHQPVQKFFILAGNFALHLCFAFGFELPLMLCPFDSLLDSFLRVTDDLFIGWFNVFGQGFGLVLAELFTELPNFLVTLIDKGFLVPQLLLILRHPFLELFQPLISRLFGLLLFSGPLLRSRCGRGFAVEHLFEFFR
ncbi:MAG: hypothetical protein ILNGONEN_00809 [Syntrophorhabdaceae bacterium]|nr:hypothetical protein [Syntrophorhabdaceae bacterium]